MIVDLFLVYQFIKRLATPFKEWDAYKLGIIDEKGNQLVKRKQFKKQKEHDAFGIFDLMITKLKRLLEKVPGGKTRIASYAAALYLIKEHKAIEDQGEDYVITEERLQELMTLVENSDYDIDALFEKAMEEDAPTNSVGGGHIAGTGGAGGEPGFSPKAMKKYKKKNEKEKPLIKRFKEM